MKQCPFCKEEVPEEATVCKYCGFEWLTFGVKEISKAVLVGQAMRAAVCLIILIGAIAF